VNAWLVGAYGPDMGGTATGVSRLVSRSDGSLAVDPGYALTLESPAFLARGETLYAALEGRGEVAAGDARFDTDGKWPCHIGVYGDTVVVANYFDGTVTVLGGATIRPEAGSGPNPAQDGPHAHATVQVAPGVILSADLGADRIVIYSLADGALSRTGSVALPPGTGPRDFLVNGEYLYILGEHAHTITVARWTGNELALISSVPLPGALDTDQASALGIGNGFLYAGLRGSNQVPVLAVSADGSELVGVTSVSSAGDWPRHLVVDGAVLHVANQLSDSVASFALGSDGIPRLIAEPTVTPSPTYLLAD
jgi:6-phosphogluconolactonase (cycloisomerase 2 family)